MRAPANRSLGAGLLGREPEYARIAALVDDARDGCSGALLVQGEPGIGKTALLQTAIEQATAIDVLRARGVESEAKLAFAGLAELLEPVLELCSEIPPLQAESVASALGVGAPVQHGHFVLLAGTLSLLAAAAERRPLLVIVDDAHWLDAPSAQALLFVARRLRYEGVALLLAQRAAHDPHGFAAAGLPTLELGGLDASVGGELVSVRCGFAIPAEVARTLCEATGGNPLALSAAADALDEAQLRGAQPLPRVLPVGERLADAFLARTARLGAQTVQALTVVAAADASETAQLARALAALDLRFEQLQEAEAAGLVSLGGAGVELEHPLLRAALYGAASPAWRRAIHRALADAHEDDEELRAWHLAAAATGPQEQLAATLQAAAQRAARRGGHMAAANLLERAAELTPDGQARARRLYLAASEAHLAGEVAWAMGRIELALSLAREPRLRAEIAHMRGSLEQYAGSTARARELLVAEAEALLARGQSVEDRRLATLVLLDAAATSILAGEVVAAHATARRAVSVAVGLEGAVGLAPGALEGTLAMVRGAAPPTLRLGTVVDELLSAGDLPASAFWLAQFAINDMVFSERYEQARAMLERTLGTLRTLSAFGVLVLPLIAQAELDFRTGRWIAARGAALEAVEIANDADELSFAGMAHATAARIDAACGRGEECQAHVARTRAIARDVGVRSAAVHATAALGLWALGEGRCEDAIRELATVSEQVTRDGVEHPAVIQWGGDLVEAQVRAGDPDGAQDSLERLQARALRSQHTGALAATERCQGMLADDGDYERCFAQARRWHRHTATPFESARTELCLGERLRREGRRIEARAPLERALSTFTQLGAEPWSRRAREELGATTPTLRGGTQAALASLTSQELRVASVVARGATNREAAAALFLSPKTVNAHLESIYRKLSIKRRSQLARMFAQPGDENTSTR